MLKKEIRKTYLQQRLNLSFQEMADQSVLIINYFNQLSFTSPEYLLTYSPMADKNEFDVRTCEEVLTRKHPSLKIAWPKMHPDHVEMEAKLVENEKSFVKNRYNILEPLEGRLLENTLIDVVFVPLIAFDQQGYRVGYGKGYYDKYLVKCKRDVVKIGFSFFGPVGSITDLNDFDVPLNFCITPTGIYEF